MQNRYKYLDRCQNDEVCICEMSQADSAQVEKIIEIAETDPAGGEKPHWKNATGLCTKQPTGSLI